VAYLGAVAKQAGHTVKIIDGGLNSVREIVPKALSFAPDFVGITCWTITRGTVWDLCDQIRRVLPRALLVLGGSHPTYCPKDALQRSGATALVIGEGEKTFEELLKAIESGSDLQTVAGLALPEPKGSVMLTARRDGLKNLDEYPLPDYELIEDFDLSKYAGLPNIIGPTSVIISSRGCVYDCTFCGSVEFWGRKWVYRSAQNVLDEIERHITKLGAKSIFFYDDNLPVRKERMREICRGIIQKGWGIQWACCSHVNMVDFELLKLMRESGCVRIDFGVESGSDKILANVKKKQKRADIIQTFNDAHRAGILPRAFLMVGNQGENEGTIDETISLIKEIQPHASIGSTIVWLLPGTQDYNHAIATGHLSANYWELNRDAIPYNLQEHSLEKLQQLRDRLMWGIARSKGGVIPIASYLMRRVWYRNQWLARFRHLIPARLR
jgi:radical SAM superfamily enzyme YgiQ (UPF0313 family)